LRAPQASTPLLNPPPPVVERRFYRIPFSPPAEAPASAADALRVWAGGLVRRLLGGAKGDNNSIEALEAALGALVADRVEPETLLASHDAERRELLLNEASD